jgi:hypothetical protein
MIENYLFNSKSCIVKVNKEGQVVIETTFAYLVIYETKIIAIILSKDEANLSTNSYKQMDQVRNVLTEENKNALLKFFTENDEYNVDETIKFIKELQPLDQYVRQPTHTYNGRYCVFLDKTDRDSIGKQGTPQENQCIGATSLATTASRAATDRLKKLGRLVVDTDKPDTVERDVSPFADKNSMDLDTNTPKAGESVDWGESDPSILDRDPRLTEEDEIELEKEAKDYPTEFNGINLPYDGLQKQT